MDKAIAVDTNVLARYVLNDDFEQAKAAARLLAGRELIDVPLSVWLDLLPTLRDRKVYNGPRRDISAIGRLYAGTT